MNNPYPAYNCAACGAPLTLKFRYTKIMTCPHCGAGLFLEDKAVKLRGLESVMADYPSLFELYADFQYRQYTFTLLGLLRFEYAHGYWDEWWALMSDGEGRWISVDEGDIAIEQPVELQGKPFAPDLQMGKTLELNGENWRVTERGVAKCIGLQGEIPELLMVGDTFDYVHLSGAQGRLMTLELSKGDISAHQGQWVDPFEVKRL